VNDSETDERELLRQSIERNEAELRDAVGELTSAVKKELTLRTQIIEHPLPWLVGGFVLGFWLGRGGESSAPL
jgi:hypothetical protein